jgi:hypothetical protein
MIYGKSEFMKHPLKKADVSCGLAIFIVACLLLWSIGNSCRAHGQDIVVTNALSTNGNPFYEPIVNVWKDVENVTNVGAFAYGSYSPASGKTKEQFGGGLMAFYDMTRYVGAGVGVDYWNRNWQMISANIKIQLPTHPLASYGLPGVTMTPLVIAGVGTPMNASLGSGGSAVTREGAGVDFGVCQALGGAVNVGLMYEMWQGTATVGRDIYHLWVGWSKGF